VHATSYTRAYAHVPSWVVRIAHCRQQHAPEGCLFLFLSSDDMTRKNTSESLKCCKTTVMDDLFARIVQHCNALVAAMRLRRPVRAEQGIDVVISLNVW
jgi:hypothetical protein